MYPKIINDTSRQFVSSSDVEKFLKNLFIKKQDDNPIFERAILSECFEKCAWIYDTTVWDDYIETKDGGEVADISTSISVRFPKTDYDWICNRMKKYLIKIGKLKEKN